MIKLYTFKILGIICNFVLAESKPVSNQLQLQLLLKADSVSDERIPDLPRIKKEPIHGRTDVKARRKRSSDTEYDYYKDTDYYNYYGVEDPVSCFEGGSSIGDFISCFVLEVEILW